jgi:hypothetical protein
MEMTKAQLPLTSLSILLYPDFHFPKQMTDLAVILSNARMSISPGPDISPILSDPFPLKQIHISLKGAIKVKTSLCVFETQGTTLWIYSRSVNN